MIRITVVNNKLDVSMSGVPNHFDCVTALGGFRVVGFGEITNPDVCQLSTAAGLRNEHPVATLIGGSFGFGIEYDSAVRFFGKMEIVGGGFCAVVSNVQRDKALIIVRNYPYVWEEKVGVVVRRGEPADRMWMIGVNGKTSTIESIRIEPPASYWKQTDRKMYVIESHKSDTWTARLRRPVDYKVSYPQVGYKVGKGGAGPKYLSLVSLCVAWALEIDQETPVAIVLGVKPTEIDLTLAASLTRVVYVATDGKIRLEMPLYDKAIGTRVTTAY